MAGGVSRYRQAYNAGNTGRGLPEGLASMADDDPMIDSAHDAGRAGTPFEDWQAANGQTAEPTAPRVPAPRSSRARGPAGRRGPRGRSSGSLGIRRAARSASVPNPTGGRLPIGLTAGAGAAGLFFGAIAYAMILSVVDYGPSGPLLWLKAKFLNEPAGGSSSSTPGPATPYSGAISGAKLQ